MPVLPSLLRDSTTGLQLELAAPEPRHQSRAIAHRVTYPCCVHSNRELVENLLRVLGFQAIERTRKRPRMCRRQVSWKI